MKRNVPLYAAGDPRADQSDQRRLDHVLPVDEVISVGLIHALEKASANLRQYADPDVFVLQVDNRVSLVDLLPRQRVVHRIWINGSLRALRFAAEEKHRVWFGISRQVRRDHDLRL